MISENPNILRWLRFAVLYVLSSPRRLDYLDFEKIMLPALKSLIFINIVIPAKAGIQTR